MFSAVKMATNITSTFRSHNRQFCQLTTSYAETHILTEACYVSKHVRKTTNSFARYEVLSVMKIHVVVIWIITPCSVVLGQQLFGVPCCLYLQAEDTGSMVIRSVILPHHYSLL